MANGHALTPGFDAFPLYTKVQSVYYEFDRYSDFGDWETNLEDTAGDAWDVAKSTVAAVRGGQVQDDSTNANDDTAHRTLVKPVYLGDKGVVAEFICKMLLSDADGSAFIAGIGNANDITSASPLDGTAYMEDGIFFIKETGDAYLDFATEKNGADTTYTNRLNQRYTMSDSGEVTLAFRVEHNYDVSGTYTIYAYVNGQILSGFPVTYTSGIPNDVTMSLTVAHRGGAADYVRWNAIGAAVYEPGEYAA